MSYDYEYKTIPVVENETEAQRHSRGAYWVVGKRVNDNKDFFDRVWKLQPLVMAIFGEKMEEVFGKLHEARAFVQVASNTLAWDEPPDSTPDNRTLKRQLRTDLWGDGSTDVDRVQVCLDEFKGGIERVCKPVVDREFSDGYIGAP
jgi:hypothetical protein